MASLAKEMLRYVLISAGGIVGFPCALLPWLERRMTSGDALFNLFAQALALVPGWPGNFIRTAYYIVTLDTFDSTAVISFGSYFSKRGSRVARGAGIGAYCVIGLVDIGQDVRIASRVSVVSGLHYHGRAADSDCNSAQEQIARLHIGERTWVGEGVVVGANIGRQCVIAIGSAVVNDVPDFGLAMGNPARLVSLKRDQVPAQQSMPA
ncbi:MAG: acyltransferase [Acidiferrobacteraceae bacterium]